MSEKSEEKSNEGTAVETPDPTWAIDALIEDQMEKKEERTMQVRAR